MRHTRLAAVLGVLLALPGLAFDLTSPSTWFGGNTVTSMGRQHDTSREVTSNGVTKVQMQHLYKEDWLVTDVDMSKAHGGITNLVAGQNIVIEEPTPGTKKISAIGGGGGGVSPEDVNFLVGLYDSTNLTPRINAKQNQLTAGSNITITVVGDQTVISATGGGGGGSDIDWHGVTNVAVTVVTEKVPSWARDPDAAITNGFAKLADLPQKISDLTNDAEYVTKAVTNGLASAADLPKKLSDLTNDTEYVTKEVTNGLATVASVTAVSNALDAAKADKAGDLEGYGITNAYTKTEVDSAITGNVVDNTTSTNGTKALSANQGRLLKDEIDRLKGRGKYLSIWNARTGLAMTSPGSDPYTYQSGDYFIVGILSPTNTIPNYKPFGTTYTTNAPSTVVETNLVAVNDTYIFDGTSWSLMHSDQPTVTFGSIAGSPEDNDALKTAFDGKRGLTDLDVYEGEDKTGNKLATTNQLHTAVNTATNALGTEISNTLTNYYKKVDNVAITTNGVGITSATSVSQLGDLPFLKRGATVYMPPDEDDPESTATWTTYTMGEIDYTGKSIKVPQKSGTMLLDVDIAAALTVTNRGQVADASDVRAGLALRRALDDMDVYSGTEPTGDRLATTTGVREIVRPMIGGATNGLRRVDDMNVYANTNVWTFSGPAELTAVVAKYKLIPQYGPVPEDAWVLGDPGRGQDNIVFTPTVGSSDDTHIVFVAMYFDTWEYAGELISKFISTNIVTDRLATTNGVNAAIAAHLTAAGVDYMVKSNAVGEAQVKSIRFTDGAAEAVLSGAAGHYGTVFKRNGLSWSTFGGNASGSRAIALGNDANAIGYESIALGFGANAGDNYATALGRGANAYAGASTAIGYGANAHALFTTVIGYNATASSRNSIAIGNEAEVSDSYSIALGDGAKASDYYSMAVGNGTAASGEHSVSLGSFSIASNYNAFVSSAFRYGSHGDNTINFGFTDDPASIYFKNKTLADIIHDEAPAPGDYENVSNAAMRALGLSLVGEIQLSLLSNRVERLSESNGVLQVAIDGVSSRLDSTDTVVSNLSERVPQVAQDAAYGALGQYAPAIRIAAGSGNGFYLLCRDGLYHDCRTTSGYPGAGVSTQVPSFALADLYGHAFTKAYLTGKISGVTWSSGFTLSAANVDLTAAAVCGATGYSDCFGRPALVRDLVYDLLTRDSGLWYDATARNTHEAEAVNVGGLYRGLDDAMSYADGAHAAFAKLDYEYWTGNHPGLPLGAGVEVGDIVGHATIGEGELGRITTADRTTMLSVTCTPSTSDRRSRSAVCHALIRCSSALALTVEPSVSWDSFVGQSSFSVQPGSYLLEVARIGSSDVTGDTLVSARLTQLSCGTLAEDFEALTNSVEFVKAVKSVTPEGLVGHAICWTNSTLATYDASKVITADDFNLTTNGLRLVTVGTRPSLETAAEWSSSVAYRQGDVVRREGVLYICTVHPAATLGPSDWGLQVGAWAEATLGVNSVAAGSTNVASGVGSHAEGINAHADGDTAHAEGVFTRASGAGSHAEGTSTLASGVFAHAEGIQAVAVGMAAHAEGSKTESAGVATHAEGQQTTADGLAAHAEGYEAHAEGIAAKASGIWTTAGGTDPDPTDPGKSIYRPASLAAGWGVEATSAGAFAWQGLPDGRDPLIAPSDTEVYVDNGPGTFNVNPVGGLDGFWVGRTNMATHVKAVARKLIKDAVGSLGEGATAADIINALKAIGD